MINVNQLTEDLRMMTDPVLQQYAAMHRNDPYVLAMAVSESNARQKMRQAAQAQMYQPQAKVVDQAIMAMGQAAQATPGAEAPVRRVASGGLTSLKTPNIEYMADGGIAGYAEGDVVMAPGSTPSYQRTDMSPGMLDFAQRSEPVIRMAGGGKSESTDPFELAADFVLKTEGGSYVEDDAGKGPSRWGILQSANPGVDAKKLTREQAKEIYKRRYWDALGGDDLAKKDPKLAVAAFDTAVNHGINAAQTMLSRSEGDIGKLMGQRRDLYNELVMRNPDQYGKYAKGWDTRLKNLSSTLERAPAPTEETPETPSTAGRVAAPVTASVLGGTTAGGLAGMGVKELLGATFKPGTTAGQAARVIGTGSAAVPLATVAGGAAATKTAADILRQAAPEQRAQFYDNQMLGAMGGDTALAAAIMNAGAGEIKPPEKPMPYGEQMANVAKRLVSAPIRKKPVIAGPGDPGWGKDLGQEPVSYGPSLGHDWQEAVPMSKTDVSDIKKEAPAAVKAQAKKEGWSQDDWLAFAAGALKSRSPYAGEAVGSGLEALLGSRQARQKQELEERKLASEEAYRGSLGKEAEAKAAYYTSERGPAQAMQIANTAFANWEKGLSALEKMQLTPEQRQAKYQEFILSSFKGLGLQVPGELTSQATGALPAVPQGVTVRKIGG